MEIVCFSAIHRLQGPRFEIGAGEGTVSDSTLGGGGRRHKTLFFTKTLFFYQSTLKAMAFSVDW